MIGLQKPKPSQLFLHCWYLCEQSWANLLQKAPFPKTRAFMDKGLWMKDYDGWWNWRHGLFHINNEQLKLNIAPKPKITLFGLWHGSIFIFAVFYSILFSHCIQVYPSCALLSSIFAFWVLKPPYTWVWLRWQNSWVLKIKLGYTLRELQDHTHW